MSTDYEMAVVPVSTLIPVRKILSETVQLADVMGYLPVRELREVLGSDWARGDGWQVVQDGAVYRRPLAAGIELELLIDELGMVSLRRSAASQVVDADDAARTEQQQEALLRSVEAECNQCVGGVIGRAIAAAVPRLAEEQGHENAVYGVELKLIMETV
jgi:hypothetical protein